MFVRNAMEDQTAVTRYASPLTLSSLVSPYSQVMLNARREVGVNVHYAFGSR